MDAMRPLSYAAFALALGLALAAGKASALEESPNEKDIKEAAANIPQPADPVEIGAFAALDKHCARCHQFGKLEGRQKPAKGFGNVLHLGEIGKDPNLVLPGNPDGSKLFQQILNKDMPYDYYKDGATWLDAPTEIEVAAIRSWIESLGTAQAAACEGRQFITSAQMLDAISADINQQQEHRIAGTRYITLTNLYNACATDEEMNVYRQGTIKLLNSLSQNSDVVTLQTIDEAGTILRFNLEDVRWEAADWEKVVAAYPYAVKPDVKSYDFVTTQLSTKVPYVRGDWFAFTASRPPLYYDLLKMPATFQELEAKLGLSTEKNIANFVAQRSGFQKSLVSRNNRLIERHTISTGVFWTSYDFAGSKSTQSLFEHPLGPKGDNAFKHDGGETIYTLPNGFNAYYLNKADGARLDKGPTEIVLDKDRKDFAVMNGISCFGCHDHGFRTAKDDIRDHVANDKNFPKEMRTQVEALYPPREVMDKYIAEDTERFHGAMKRAGLDPSLKLEGIEMINALSNKYEKDVDLRLAASEFGLEQAAFEQAAGERGGDARVLLKRLQQAVVPRDNFEGQFSTLLTQITDDEMIKLDGAKVVEVAKVNVDDTKVDGTIKLTLFADRTTYKQNELPVFIVQSDQDCHLTLINVDDKGTGTVIFPNKFEQDTFLKANQAFEYPRPDAPFQFRLKDVGTETVIALCNSKSRDVDTIVHNFNAKDFTDLGDYAKFVTRAIVVEAKEVKDAAVKPVVADVPVKSGVARVAIKLTVEPY
jgi:hypothetical protein